MEEEPDDIKVWLQEISMADPLSQLRTFKADHPSLPIPHELKFIALYAPILGGGDGAISFDHELAIAVDKIIAEDEAGKGGGQYKSGRLAAFTKIELLTNVDGLSLEEAYDLALDELQEGGIEDSRVNLDRAYQRYVAKTLVDQIGQAISSVNQIKAIALLEELRRRHNTFGVRWPA